MNKTNIKKTITFILYMVLAISAVYLNSIVANLEDKINILGMKMLPSGINGVLSSFVIVGIIGMIIVNRRYGVILGSVIVLISLFSISMGVFVAKNFESVPGFTLMLVAIIIELILNHALKKIEQNEKVLYKMSCTDPMTELPNRRSVDTYLNNLIKKNEPFYVAFLDLDNFKNINDIMGHDCGDELLCKLVNRWNDIKEDDFIARQGGDEFVIIVSDNKGNLDISTYLKKYLNAVSDKIIIGDKEYFGSVSIGVTKYPDDTTNINMLYRYADTAMYNAKNNGRNRISIFDDTMMKGIEEHVNIEALLREALKYNKFELVFQPQFYTKDKRLRGFETLLRLNNNNGVAISPSVFIKIAEETNLISKVGYWVLDNSVKTFKPILENFNDKFVLSVNISSSHLLEKDFVKEVMRILNANDFPPTNLEIEITESVFIDSLEDARDVLFKLKAHGIQVALDDFGTGYATLSYLSNLPIDLLKIDKSFIDRLDVGIEGEKFVQVIIAIGELYEFDVISEGVEYGEQLEILKRLGCELMQGYYWGCPMNIEKVKKEIL